MTGNLHAFADESFRQGRYLICAATVLPGDLHKSRSALRGLRLRGQRKLHFADESDSRRRTILSALGRRSIETRIYTATHRSQVEARSAIMRAMVVDLRSHGVIRLILDAREGQDHVDRAAIRRIVGGHPDPPFEYQHHPSATEPLLWIPDAIAWAWGRGGTWRSRVESLGLIAAVSSVNEP